MSVTAKLKIRRLYDDLRNRRRRSITTHNKPFPQNASTAIMLNSVWSITCGLSWFELFSSNLFVDEVVVFMLELFMVAVFSEQRERLSFICLTH